MKLVLTETDGLFPMIHPNTSPLLPFTFPLPSAAREKTPRPPSTHSAHHCLETPPSSVAPPALRRWGRSRRNVFIFLYKVNLVSGDAVIGGVTGRRRLHCPALTSPRCKPTWRRRQRRRCWSHRGGRARSPAPSPVTHTTAPPRWSTSPAHRIVHLPPRPP